MHHTKYNPKDKEFWNFTWDQMATIDLPTMVDYALKTTGQSKLAYIGHSQGTTMAFECFTSSATAGNNLYPPACTKDYTDKISIFIAIAPVTYLQHVESDFLNGLAALHVDELLEALGENEFLMTNKFLEKWFPQICKNSLLKDICLNTYCLVSGCNEMENNVQMNLTRLPLYFANLPAGTSTLNVGHWAQLIRSKKFQMFDYGGKNFNHYHQNDVPQINLSNLHVDIAIYHAGLDVLGDVLDYNIAIKQIPQNRVKNVMFYPTFGHIDMVWGINNWKLFFPDIVNRITSSFN